MERGITIGIPRAFLYYKYKDLWETFFKELGCNIILSPESNKEILRRGIEYSIDENCLSAKIYMGHVYSLIDKVDYILVPRFCSFGHKEIVCTKFNAMYDIVGNTFKGVKLIHYNVDVLKRKTEFKGFMKMGLIIEKNIFKVIKAYVKAKKIYHGNILKRHYEQHNLISNSNKLKMLVVAHPYNIYDKLMGVPIIKYLETLNILPIYADKVEQKECVKRSKKISTNLQWTYSKELIGAIDYYHDKIDGIIFISTFPCGPDSLVNELCIRKIKDIPILNIVLDELQSEVGLYTRIESFVDIITARQRKKVYG
ncbi:MAG: acyl-CoA dehydratase activase-related protein [Bacilli bacterium]